MALVNSISWLTYLLLFTITNHDSRGEESKGFSRKHDLMLITLYRQHIENKHSNGTQCTEDYNLLEFNKIFQDYSFWDNEIRTTNNVANYITSMWRFKDAANRSLVENEETIYTLAKTIALSSQYIYGSVICFDKFKFRGRRQFCPYAFKNKTQKNRTVVRDLGRKHDYLTTPSPPPPGKKQRHTFIWWHVSRKYLTNDTFIEENTAYYDVNLDNPTRNSRNASKNHNMQYYNITTKYIPPHFGKWTTPYYDCFGGQTWMITYLVPFYNEANKYLGCVSFDIELDSLELDECDPPQTIQPEKRGHSFTVQFYGAHACQNKTTKCVHVHGGGFKAGNYRCVCRKGFYFPDPSAEKKYFEGKEVMQLGIDKTKYDCLPCREGCEECVDDTPCMYQRNMSLRTVILVINEIVKATAIALGVFVFVFKDSKIIKASSPVFMEIIAFGVVLMYFEITLGYFEDSVVLCIARSWLYHTGFILAFGSLLLKTWRIAVIFRLRTAKMIELTDKTLLKYLVLMLISVACYLIIWTWTHTHEFEIKKTTAGYKYRRCVREWFSNAIEIVEVVLLLWGVWLCLRVRNAPSAYNESKYIAWCIYNTVFIMILVGLLRIVLDNFHNPDVSYVVDFLSTHVVATIMLVLLFLSKIYLLRNFRKDSQRRYRANSATSTSAAADTRKSPFHLNRLVDGTLVCETEEEQTALGLETENVQLREEIRSLIAKLAVFENKQARENKRKGSNAEDEFKIHNNDFQIVLADSETESSRDGHAFSDKRRRKRSVAADSTTSNGSVFCTREEKGGSLLEDIKNAGTHDHFLAVPKQSVSDEDTMTVMSNVSNGST